MKRQRRLVAVVGVHSNMLCDCVLLVLDVSLPVYSCDLSRQILNILVKRFYIDIHCVRFYMYVKYVLTGNIFC